MENKRARRRLVIKEESVELGQALSRVRKEQDKAKK
jgi:hypothetical protein